MKIKTRTKKANVRRNDYDLYQLIGYLLANFVQFNAYFDPFLHKKHLCLTLVWT